MVRSFSLENNADNGENAESLIAFVENEDAYCHESCPPVPLMISEVCVNWILEKETEHQPKSDYLLRLRSGGEQQPELRLRRKAFDWISKVHSSYKFKPSTLWLSMNYLDRFLSRTYLPDCFEDKAWVRQILSIACLSIAVKMEETIDPPKPNKLQLGGESMEFAPDAIQKMELIVLNRLEWKMNSPTPFSFVEYFVNSVDHHHPERDDFVDRSVRLILRTIKVIEFLEFKPSEIAFAAAILIVGKEINTMVDFNQTVSLFIPYLLKDRVVKCMELMKDLSTEDNVGGGLLSPEEEESSPVWVQSPTGVLDAKCFSSGSMLDDQ